MTQVLPIAAVVYAGHGAVDGVVAEFARGLQRRGRQVRGLLQNDSPAGAGSMCGTVLVDLHSSERYRISQDLGSGSVSCRVDPGGLAIASIVLRRALAEDTDLVVVNRFGVLEATGGGFAAEMLALMEAERPLLAAVAEKHREHWLHFTGGAGVELPVEIQALESWFAGLGQR
ncbi:MAG: DUF2478 domain-containing protein [Gammaproteobacteria bacterium]|nr:DUF2478 domain-containing protein [Gammaproteobacteria bacterium]